MGDLPSGKHSQFAIENGPVEIVDLPIKNGGSFDSYVKVYQRVVDMNGRFNGKFNGTLMGFNGSSFVLVNSVHDT